MDNNYFAIVMIASAILIGCGCIANALKAKDNNPT